ncbi:response regulator receiver domain-containing protein [Roseimicrobium gellanilyticum]|uniref:Response regulator receiver domain-containing protein n=1 Tax=Roseimicrobium gellanilyticum TaxID=748857 RepID=A0A366H9R2_9BACT|nr:response regulator [Roseimicrobium gellanilyticum]RBP38163.1 response regulator receiver domain-containing protein [Roseimicrobium gellanilyticum]
MNSKISPRTVRVVDDDEGISRLIARLLQREGYLTESARSGAEAVDWLRIKRADLMLLDLKLRDMEGTELLDILEKQQCGIPFIVITGQGDERVAVKLMKQGALDYVAKDSNFLEHLPAAVKRSLAQLEREAALAKSEEERRRLERELLAISEQEQRRIGHDLHNGLVWTRFLTCSSGVSPLAHPQMRTRSVPSQTMSRTPFSRPACLPVAFHPCRWR